MKFELDLWLERSDPRIILRDVASGRVLMYWDSSTLRRSLLHGDTCLEDLLDTQLSCAERLGLVREAGAG